VFKHVALEWQVVGEEHSLISEEDEEAEVKDVWRKK